MAFDLPEAVRVLQRTPGALRGLLDGLGPQWTHARYGEGTFSPFDVVGHLIHGDRTNWMARVRHLLACGESAPFPPFDRFAMYALNEGRSMGELLVEFAKVRDASLAELRTLDLTPADFGRCSTHPELGRVTLGQLLATWVVHDLAHIRQIATAMAYQYRDDVGPWAAYLSILPKP